LETAELLLGGGVARIATGGIESGDGLASGPGAWLQYPGSALAWRFCPCRRKGWPRSSRQGGWML